MFRIIVDFFNAGTDTTATAMSWAILFLIKHPKVQEKCRAEILKVSCYGIRLMTFRFFFCFFSLVLRIFFFSSSQKEITSQTD